MIKEKTVLILGAGASWHYGYPTGEELPKKILKESNKIIEIINRNDNTFKNLSLHSLDKKNLETLIQKINHDNTVNIDSLLTLNKSLEKEAKFLIALTLLKYEDESQMILEDENNKNRGNWYKYLIHSITSTCKTKEDLVKSLENLKIITFNYDMSLEYFLWSRLKNTELFEDYKDLFSDLKIHHVYGQLYNHDLLSNSEHTYGKYKNLDYSNLSYLESLIKLANNSKLEIIGENKSQNNVPNYKEFYAEVKKIYFLGYGFDENNNALIGLNDDSIPKETDLFFTNYNNLQKINDLIKELFPKWYNQPDWYKKISQMSVFDALSKHFNL